MTDGTYRVLVTGSREWSEEGIVRAVLDERLEIARELGLDFVLIHGGCHRGADAMADRWGVEHAVQVVRYPADWSGGKSAGPARNRLMVETSHPDVAVAFIQGPSRGTHHCVSLLERSKIPVLTFTGPE